MSIAIRDRKLEVESLAGGICDEAHAQVIPQPLTKIKFE